jgi:hypothetical protein
MKTFGHLALAPTQMQGCIALEFFISGPKVSLDIVQPFRKCTTIDAIMEVTTQHFTVRRENLLHHLLCG